MNAKQEGTFYGKDTSQKLDLIENNSLLVIVTILKIYKEIIPLVIDVGPITLCDLFKTL